MGITISYRGKLAELDRIEDFEDRLVDFALEMGGLAQIWRSFGEDTPQRMVRGVILHLAPGQEATSLLVSPEGWLIGLVDIADAEQAMLSEPPWCFVKTQFGPVEGHVALVEMFRTLKKEFIPDLEVSDEGGYWETKDLAELTRRQDFLRQAIEGMAEGLGRHGLSREAAEDPAILCRHLERIAARVHAILKRPSEHPPVTFSQGEGFAGTPDPETTEAEWDEMFKHNRRQQERLQRAIEERRGAGEDDDAAFEDALGDLGLEVPGEEVPSEVPGEDIDETEELWSGDDAGSFADLDEAGFEDESAAADLDDRKRHPLLEAATDLFARLQAVSRDREPQFEAPLSTLFQGAGDVVGGLAQALSGRYDEEDDDGESYGLRVVQLKRALRGAAFARGALFLLRPTLSAEQFDELYGTLGQLEREILQVLGRLRSQQRPGES